MSRAVNLLPECCHNARLRAVRRNAWTAGLLATGLLVVGTWAALRATDGATDRLNRKLASLQGRQSNLDRQLLLAAKLRDDLADRGRALAALRQRHPLPEQLLALARLAPSGVVFTEVRTEAPGRARLPVRHTLKSTRVASAKPGEATASQEPPPRIVQINGYSIDHDELTRLLEILQQQPQWEQVELLRAARQPYRAGVALAFGLECRQQEGPP